MRVFSVVYDRVLKWSEHPSAQYILAGISFTEASCFPIPPDVLLIPMGLSAPHRAWYLATLTTFFSVLGGLLGYFLGMFFMNLFFVKAVVSFVT